MNILETVCIFVLTCVYVLESENQYSSSFFFKDNHYKNSKNNWLKEENEDTK